MNVTGYILPILIALLIVYALIKRVNVYDAFVEGASQALPMLKSVLPYLAAMLAAISVFRGSGALGYVTRFISPVLKAVGIQPELAPLIALRPLSGSASLAMLQDVLIASGADSDVGRAASVMVGSTETVFYTVAVYFGAAGITKTRHAIPAALISGAAGVLSAVYLCRFM